MSERKSLSILNANTSAVKHIINTVKNTPVLTKDDHNFLVNNSKHLSQVTENTHMWRTEMQKLSIISDNYHPTLHSKFHQAMLEQKVQFEQTMYLAKDFEMKKLEIEELECDLDELGDTNRDEIKRKKIMIDIQFKQYELKNMQTAMKYRMSEVKGWQKIQEKLLQIMKDSGLKDEEIWQKDAGEVSSMFYQSLTKMQGIKNSTDGGERNNLIALAKFAIDHAKKLNIYDKLKSGCNKEQLDSLNFLKDIGS